jgi:hypothetical protein
VSCPQLSDRDFEPGTRAKIDGGRGLPHGGGGLFAGPTEREYLAKLSP